MHQDSKVSCGCAPQPDVPPIKGKKGGGGFGPNISILFKNLLRNRQIDPDQTRYETLGPFSHLKLFSSRLFIPRKVGHGPPFPNPSFSQTHLLHNYSTDIDQIWCIMHLKSKVLLFMVLCFPSRSTPCKRLKMGVLPQIQVINFKIFLKNRRPDANQTLHET